MQDFRYLSGNKVFLITLAMLLIPYFISAFPAQSGWFQYFSGDLYSSPVIADLDGDGLKEVLATTYNPFKVLVFSYDGTPYCDSWPKTFSYTGGTPPSVADLDGDGDLEIVVGTQMLYAWHHTGELVDGFPTTETSANGYFRTAPSIGDLTGDGFPEIAMGNFDCEFYVWDNQGNVLPGFPKIYEPPDCAVQFSAAIGDLDLDQVNEVVIGANNGHIYAYNADGSLVMGIWDITTDYERPWSDITLGDVDYDSFLEVLFVTDFGDRVPIILNNDTTYLEGWPPFTLASYSPGGLVMGDLDHDGKLEVVTGTNAPCTIYVWEGESGRLKKGWPVVLSDGGIGRNMLLGDIDGDGTVDLMAVVQTSMSTGKVYAWSVRGQLLTGFPLSIVGGAPHSATGFIDDIDHDGDVEIGAGVGNTYGSSEILIWDLPYAYHARAMPWPQDRHDPAHTNNYNYQWPDPSPPVPDLALPGLLTLIVLLTLGFRGRRLRAGDRRVKSRRQESGVRSQESEKQESACPDPGRGKDSSYA